MPYCNECGDYYSWGERAEHVAFHPGFTPAPLPFCTCIEKDGQKDSSKCFQHAPPRTNMDDVR